MSLKYLLEKVSIPGWEKEFLSEGEARIELLKHICDECITGTTDNLGENGESLIEDTGFPAPNVDDIRSLLSTPCGCEYSIEEIEDRR